MVENLALIDFNGASRVGLFRLLVNIKIHPQTRPYIDCGQSTGMKL